MNSVQPRSALLGTLYDMVAQCCTPRIGRSRKIKLVTDQFLEDVKRIVEYRMFRASHSRPGALSYVIGQTIIFSCCGLFFFFFFLSFFSLPNLSSRRLDVYHTSAHGVNLECRSETCCARLAGNTGRKIVTKNRHLDHHRTTLSGHIFATKACIDNRKKTC